jgi:hypothetical protein
MAELRIPPDGLAVFIDDTGHEQLAGNHTFYGLGGCAVMGSDFNRLIAGPWAIVRLLVTGNEDTPLHASTFGRTATSQQLGDVVRFFRENPFMRIAAAGTTATQVPDAIPLMRVVLETLKLRIVDVAKWMPFRSMQVVFEDNPRANRLVATYFGDFKLTADGQPIPVRCYRMPKRANNPALEVADFIANAVGGHARRTLVQKKSGFGKDFKAIFHDIDGRLVSFMGIETVTETLLSRASDGARGVVTGKARAARCGRGDGTLCREKSSRASSSHKVGQRP